MSIARSAIHDWERRTRRPGAHHNDPHFQHHNHVLREILERLEIVLEDEGVPEDTIRRAIRCMLYGSPHTSDAELRQEQQKLLAEVLQNRPVITGLALPDDVKDWLGTG